MVEESDGDLMGDGVNIAARLEGVAQTGSDLPLRTSLLAVKGRLDLMVTDLGATQLKNIAEPIRVYSLEVGQPVQAKQTPAAEPEMSREGKELTAGPARRSLQSDRWSIRPRRNRSETHRPNA
jgi:adenylate cyclase